MTDVIYGDYSWNEQMRFMIDTIDEDEARRRFASGEYFAVAVGDNLATSVEESRAATTAGIALPVPRFSLEIRFGTHYSETFFYNEYGSIVAIYQFRRHDERTLFVSDVIFYTYPEEPRFFGQNECLIVEDIEFRLDGTSRTMTNNRSKPMIDVVDRCDVDLTKNWEPIPIFGNWTSMGRADRRPPQEPEPMHRRPW